MWWFLPLRKDLNAERRDLELRFSSFLDRESRKFLTSYRVTLSRSVQSAERYKNSHHQPKQ